MKFLILIIYSLSVAFYLLHLLLNRKFLAQTGFFLLIPGVLLHIYQFAGGLSDPLLFPASHLGGVLSFFSVLLGCVFIAYQVKNQTPALGYIVVPAITLFYMVSIILPGEGRIRPELRTVLFPLHVTLAILGYAFFFLSFATGFFYLLQERNIKFKIFSREFRRIPPLVELDDLNYRSVRLGFTFITLGMLTGSLWSERLWGTLWNWDPKEIMTVVLWLVYASYLHLRLIAGWKGRKSAILSVAGFLILLIVFFGRKLIPYGYHVYI